MWHLLSWFYNTWRVVKTTSQYLQPLLNTLLMHLCRSLQCEIIALAAELALRTLPPKVVCKDRQQCRLCFIHFDFLGFRLKSRSVSVISYQNSGGNVSHLPFTGGVQTSSVCIVSRFSSQTLPMLMRTFNKRKSGWWRRGWTDEDAAFIQYEFFVLSQLQSVCCRGPNTFMTLWRSWTSCELMSQTVSSSQSEWKKIKSFFWLPGIDKWEVLVWSFVQMTHVFLLRHQADIRTQ